MIHFRNLKKNEHWSDVKYFIKRYTNSLKFHNYGIERFYEQFVEFKGVVRWKIDVK